LNGETPPELSKARILSKEPEVREDRLVREDEHFFYYDRYINGKRVLHGEFMMLKKPLWFLGRTAEVLEQHCHITFDKENIERFENMFERDIVEGYYYLGTAGKDGHSAEVAKWMFGPITTEMNETGRKISHVCSPTTLRFFVAYLMDGKFPRHFAKDIFDILLEKKPLPHKVIPLLDEIVADPRFAAMDTSVVDAAVAAALAANPEKAIEAKTNPKLVQWFVGQVLKANKGMSPASVKEVLEKQFV
jgi:Asp-tRNA(Asn)/Glu-tRNA(Gln) amidotransferase B subunit